MNRKTTVWCAHADQILRKLWMAYSAAEVAETISAASAKPVNRKAVIGRAYRLGLPRKKAASKAARARPVKLPTPKREAAPRPSRRFYIPAERAAPRAFESVAPTRTLETLDRHECRFPIGDVGEPGFGFCGRRSVGSYCPLHHVIAYLPLSRRKGSAAAATFGSRLAPYNTLDYPRRTPKATTRAAEPVLQVSVVEVSRRDQPAGEESRS